MCVTANTHTKTLCTRRESALYVGESCKTDLEYFMILDLSSGHPPRRNTVAVIALARVAFVLIARCSDSKNIVRLHHRQLRRYQRLLGRSPLLLRPPGIKR